ncbi:aromatic acid exporter family protein [Bacillus sp. HMF5848]|uniref:FUSC family protein n=1 Tax=Bacillus sp. HMF5848 TaxID=2495421 RepID=UPI000F7A11C9|nr:aromatic acid exporter family protein [Bacillus sp. HMF5848]RSK26155.1 aromatic acid exporter family protein [Bacillus sp. HMF5848]
MKVGARILKTGIAITMSLYLATLLQLPTPVFAGIAAIFAIQPSIYRSYLSVIEQVQANVIGAFFAIMFVLLFGNDPFVIGLTAIIVIAINIRLKTESTIAVAVVTVVAIMQSPGDHFIQFALVRFSTVMLGVFSAFAVNLIFIPPKYEHKLYNRIVELTEEIFKWIRITTRNAAAHGQLRLDIDHMKERRMKLDQLYLLYKEERSYFKKHTFAKSRKLVLFRQKIVTLNRLLDLLKILHRMEHEFHQTPLEFQQLVTTELDCLMTCHEQALLKFAGKIKTNSSFDNDPLLLCGTNIVEQFLAIREQADDSGLKHYDHLFPLIGWIIDYREQIIHLNRLIDSFQNYHTNDELDI